MSAATIARSLKRPKFSNDGWMACCPAHNDRNPSLSIKDAENEKVLVHCFAGCDQNQVINALKSMGLWSNQSDEAQGDTCFARKRANGWTPVLPVPETALAPNFQHRKHGYPSATWTYNNSEGRTLGHVSRFDLDDGNKEIIPYTFCKTPDGRQEWRWKAFETPRPLYGLDRLANRPIAPVLVTEGEKAVDAAAVIFPDHVIISSPSGSNAAGKADWSPLKGRDVIIWPDHDEPGTKYAEDVARLSVEAGAISVTIVAVPQNFPEKWDLADERPDDWDKADLEKLLINATEPPPPDMGEVTLTELANLPPIEYDQRRTQTADDLGIRVSTLDEEIAKRRPIYVRESETSLFKEIEAWNEPIDGAVLLEEIRQSYIKYLILPDGADTASALWVLFAHTHDAATISPILAINSPEKRCGKTTHLSVTQSLVPKALPAANITAAAIYRGVEKWHPTLLIDEADTFIKPNDELRGVLNSGHNRNSAFVIRCSGEDYEAVTFNTWCPKVIALIGKLPDTLSDRSIEISLRRKLPGEHVERFRSDRTDELKTLARKAVRWAKDNVEILCKLDPEIPMGLHDRAADNWRPLFSIADQAGGKWPEIARKVAVALSGGEDIEDNSEAVVLLADIRRLFADKSVKRLATSALLEHLNEMEERPWPEFRRGLPITARQIAQLLRPFGVNPSEKWINGQNKRGYEKNDFEDAWSRYLDTQEQVTSSLPANPLEPAGSVGKLVDSTARLSTSLAGEKSLNPANNNVPSGLAGTPHPIPRDEKGIPDLDNDEEFEEVVI